MPVIDLFAGAGGLSLGAARAGFTVAASVELDEFAISTHARNFPNSVHLSVDVASLSGDSLLEAAGVQYGELDGLIGGPPCQGFSTMGRRDIADSRNDLFGHFFRLVSEMRPKFFLAENVPGILNEKYKGIVSAALSLCPSDYEVLAPLTVKASDYGAPTTRTRVFFIGYDRSQVSFRLQHSDFAPRNIEKVNVAQALAGLPQKISEKWQSEESGWRPYTVITPDTPFLQRVYGEIPEGVGDPLALKRFAEKLQVWGCMGTKHTPEVISRFSKTIPGGVDKVSKAVRLDPDGFCPTLRAGTSKDKGSYQAVRPIHFSAPRVITPREAARLQGFPDWFVFHSTKWHSFRQIGNSVPPILAESLLRVIFSRL
ncbi:MULTISPECIES: DNA cytosine methyltransferase [Pseudomonas]|uniref:DNA cytosine methyltransferase n=1 Tax=Pseudomonas TaxID=286 RepID=UPI0004F3022C|nr:MULTISPECIES: DNA cytosine methyltransferase [Pseudomonas]EKQ6362456.1 DNA cytosine methyltransferase [Pseudomonas aeruginosa]MBG4635278.1 DNA cytosine methyltransferase [Pseudomonas aeruginosa]MBG4857590.1 DNA cytosine methyltransferase [Pseudomonas aeruginosa]MBG4893987.1 DNA cytosine methyltransferase [Pseudomonas aeruginosa]MBG4960237.1 DNA cytosine methyltransferase [Pseudomonas aeruginosa]